jgi:hypothetical protein
MLHGVLVRDWTGIHPYVCFCAITEFMILLAFGDKKLKLKLKKKKEKILINYIVS